MKHLRILSGVVFFCATLGPIQQSFAETDAEIDVLLQGLAREMNAKLPSGNRQSLIVSVMALPKKRFVYSTVVGTPAGQWTADMKAHSRRIAINDYCTNPNLAAWKEFGVTVSWQMSDQDGKHVATNTVSPRECPR